MIARQPKTVVVLLITFLMVLASNSDSIVKATTNRIIGQGMNGWQSSNPDKARSKQIDGISDVEEDTVYIDVVVRDFQDTHADFEGSVIGLATGLVSNTIGLDGNPVFVASDGSGGITNSGTFNQWYNNVDGVNLGTVVQLPLTETSPGSGIYTYGSSSFFPIDNQLFGNQGRPHNYHFTTEFQMTFTYNGGEVFEFTGDDDVWVFINGKLEIDLGGVHTSQVASVSLDDLGLTPGETYSLDMFHAERHTTQSNFIIETTIVPLTRVFLPLVSRQ